MTDWIGLIFLFALAVAIYLGLRRLARTRVRTTEEFERNAAESTLVGAGANALHEILNPAEGRAKEVKMQLKEGRYNRKQREGKAGGDDGTISIKDGEN
jgi:membrane protein implicated in regulation of membrane protease activity